MQASRSRTPLSTRYSLIPLTPPRPFWIPALHGGSTTFAGMVVFVTGVIIFRRNRLCRNQPPPRLRTPPRRNPSGEGRRPASREHRLRWRSSPGYEDTHIFVLIAFEELCRFPAFVWCDTSVSLDSCFRRNGDLSSAPTRLVPPFLRKQESSISALLRLSFPLSTHGPA